MKRLAGRIDRISNSRNLAIVIIACIVLLSTMNYLIQVLVYNVYGAAAMPDTSFVYGYEDIQHFFDTLGPEGLQAWSLVHLLDILFPLAYSFAFLIGIAMELKIVYPQKRELRVLFLVPLIAAIADYLENLLIASQIASYPSLSPTIISIASFATMTKWIALGFAFAIVIVLFFVWIIRRFRK
jgi:hypothetical protein